MKREKEKRCAEYINTHLEAHSEEPLKEGTLEFYTWKSELGIRDIDLYHKIAQALQQKELGRGFEGLFYLIRVPREEGDQFGDSWEVTLVGDSNKKFLDKYGEHYEVTSIR